MRFRATKSLGGRRSYTYRAFLIVGQVQVLSDHIEKLMMFLKHEATQKAKAHEQQRRLQKELELVKASPASFRGVTSTAPRLHKDMRRMALCFGCIFPIALPTTHPASTGLVPTLKTALICLQTAARFLV